jgi:hypothetical protein
VRQRNLTLTLNGETTMAITFKPVKATKTQAQHEADALLAFLEVAANWIANAKSPHARYTRVQAWKKACTIESNIWEMIADANGYVKGRAGMQMFVIDALYDAEVDFGEYTV